MPTTPNAAQNISVRNTPPSKPGMRPAGTRQNQAPQRGAQQTAFAQALTQAQLTRRSGAGLASGAGLNAASGAGAGLGMGAAEGMDQGLGAGTPLAQQLANIQMLAQRAAPVPPAAAATATKPAPAAARPTLDLPGNFGAIVDQAAKKYGVDPALIAAVMQTESNFNPDAVSRAGARGLMQLMPATARGLGVTDAHDPVQAVMGGAKMLGQLLEKYNGKTDLALAAYNAGSGAVDKFGGIPPYDETRKYVPLVLGAYERFRQQAGTSGAPTAGR